MATRWGICGAGKISHDWNVAMKTLPAEEHQVVAVAARSLERAQDFAKKHSIPKAYGSYEELAKDPNIAGLPHSLVIDYETTDSVRLSPAPFTGTSYVLPSYVRSLLWQGIWSRCFPVQREVSRLLAEEALGEVKVVKAYFGSPQLHIPRSVEKELGGGALLDIGVYCLQFVLLAFQGERPESIHATGHRLESGVDEVMFVVLKFSRNRIGLCGFSIGVPLPNDATISGTKGSIRIPSPMWCPSALVVNGKETEYPLPEPCMPMNFTNSTGLRYEAQEVRQCLLKGLKESIRMPLADSALLTEVMDEARRQVGVVFSQDSQ
ncbi:trans-1,2-dihydrobenzene-1,2-diol dehydrogenase-like [Sardina pilchardus]|uniref:trans-1,2-dihydrobenzene-1,2-diol dehydrogenase-like n=1 Tax=Sardina pilchardus TaxID=27697 RepID=UPI002E12668B